MPTLKDPKLFHIVDVVYHSLVGLAALYAELTGVLTPGLVAKGAVVYAALNVVIRLIKQYVPAVDDGGAQ